MELYGHARTLVYRFLQSFYT